MTVRFSMMHNCDYKALRYCLASLYYCLQAETFAYILTEYHSLFQDVSTKSLTPGPFKLAHQLGFHLVCVIGQLGYEAGFPQGISHLQILISSQQKQHHSYP